jgi:hypothetical protein
MLRKDDTAHCAPFLVYFQLVQSVLLWLKTKVWHFALCGNIIEQKHKNFPEEHQNNKTLG